jgi:hypothetical protein
MAHTGSGCPSSDNVRLNQNNTQTGLSEFESARGAHDPRANNGYVVGV